MALKRLTDHAGYFMIDHRNSPGLSASDVAHVPGAIAVPGGQQLEADTKQCRHCERTILLRSDRVRPRGYCQRCDAYICDACAATMAVTGVCRPFARIVDEAQTIAEKFVRQPDHPDANPDIVLTDAWKEASPILVAQS